MAEDRPDPCKAVLDELFQTKAWLHRYWRYYVALYGSSPERFDVFNKRTGEIFGAFKRTLGAKIVLELAKLLGTHQSGKYPVVSIKRAIVDLPFPADDE